MKPTPGIHALLRHARLVAFYALANEHVGLEYFTRIDRLIRDAVLTQADAGLWSEYGVASSRDLVQLAVRSRHGIIGRNETPIVVDWDFSRTKLSTLVIA